MGEGGVLKPVQQEMLKKRSQDLKEFFFDTGSFVFFSKQYIFDSSDAGISSSYIGSIVDKYKAVDIDTLDDWFFAEAIFYGIKECNKNLNTKVKK